jgi:YVTN family beta-propeller protein
MRLLDGFSRAGAVRRTAVLVATVAVAACCVGVSSAGAEEGVIRTIPVGEEPQGVSSDGTHVWVAIRGEKTVSEIEASSGTVIRTIPVGKEPVAVSSDGTHVWVANFSDGTVSEIEASSGTVIRTIPVGEGPSGVSSDGTHVWVTNSGEGVGDTVSEIEASNGTVIRTIHVGSEPVGVSSDGTHVWVTNLLEGTVSEIEASNGTVIRTIPVGSEPVGVSSDGTHVWVTNFYEDTVSEIEASNGTVISTIPVGEEAHPQGVSSNGTHVWVANTGGVSEIEASSGTVISTIPVGTLSSPLYPEGVSSDGTDVWVTALGDSPDEGAVIEIPTSYIYTAPPPEPPEPLIFSPANDGTYLQGAVVRMSFLCTEAGGGPGIESCTYSSGASGTPGAVETSCTKYTQCDELDENITSDPLETSTLGPHTYTVTAKSKDGEIGTASITYTVVSAQQTASTSTAPVAATVGGSPKPETTPKAISPVTAFSLPSTKQCVSHRKFTIHVRKLPGITWVSAVIKINHKRIKTVGRSHITALVNLTGLPKGTFVLSITAKATNGRTVTETRTYHTCVPKSKRHYAPPKL